MVRLLVFLFVGLTSTAAGQSSDDLFLDLRTASDSLKEALSFQKATARTETLLNLSESYLTRSPDSVIHYAKLALSEAIDQSNDSLQARAYWLVGSGERIRQNFDSAEIAYRSAIVLTRDEEIIANCRMGLGGIAYADSKFDVALKNFIEATTKFEALGKEERQAAGYVNIGLILNATDNDERALEYFKKAIEISRRFESQNTLLPALVNISTLFHKKKQYDSAIRYAEECYNLSKISGSSYGMAMSLSILSQANAEVNQPQKAFQQATEAKELFESMGIEQSALNMMRYQAISLEKLGRHSEALKTALELESQINRFSGNGMKENLYGLLSELYEVEGNHKKALYYQKLFFEEYKGFISSEKDKYVNELETKYETEKKELQIANLTQENELKELRGRQNLFSFLLSLAVLFFVGLLVVLIYQKRLMRQKEQTAIHRQQLLRSQMNPHFIFNALSSIRSFLFDEKNVKEAIGYLGKFARLMRTVLDLSSKEWVTLEEELAALRLYLEIQQLRFGQKFEFELDIQPELDTNEIYVPPLLAQPFIENSIEHGFKNVEKGGRVQIKCESQGDKLIFCIQDNGVGIEHFKLEKDHESRALAIFKDRLELLSKKLRKKLDFTIEDLGKSGAGSGTLVAYQLPLLKNI